ncbi:MAG: primosomal protein N' [Gallionella sp.]|nr:primosomal protein N' [Gallionella sp.]MDD4947661.1 primosomal protein N' [Gallionella sp.]
MPIIRVALDVPLATLFDYSTLQSVAVGQRVVVPFGKRTMIGVVMGISDETDLPASKIKAVEQVLDGIEPFSPTFLSLVRFCSDYYHCPIGQVAFTAMPTRLRSADAFKRRTVSHCRITEAGKLSGGSVLLKRKSVARAVLGRLAAGSCTYEQLKSVAPTAVTQIKWLQQQGWIERFEGELHQHAANVARPHLLVNAHNLTIDQQQVVATVSRATGYACFLLHGITGSGKTEVYVHLMHNMLQRGGQVLLLVPEINLTPQLEGYFRSRFPDTALVSLHSGLSDNQRLDNWLEAKSGAASIVLGTRLAVFAELPKLSLLLVDEEHDASFKQQDGLRYSARDVAIFRARQSGVSVVLGSATPSLESFYNAQLGRYRLLRLRERAQAGANLPAISCINTNHSVLFEGISENLLREVGLRVERGEQSLLFINRRGYAPVLMCGECGWLSNCRHCAGKMVLHLQERRLRCHHCGFQVRLPSICPDCGQGALHPVGSGTQRIEHALQVRFPEARILRVDSDSTRNKRSWQAMREQIQANEVDILVGTQMLAKGHDFPDVTLVGILNPDSALYSADFRAAERLFAQLMQVAGRAGRAEKPGQVLIQTAFPDHPLFRCLMNHDFDEWAGMQLAERRKAGFPPFYFQAMLRAEGKDESEVYAYLNKARAAAVALNMPVEVLGVVPASLARRANHIRAQLLIQAESRKLLQQFLYCWQPHLDTLPIQKIRSSLDIDPLEF